MNKTYLIAGGASVVSLAIGSAGGYFLAKRRFDATLDARIDEEVKKTKKHFSMLKMQADKPASPADIKLVEPEQDEVVLEPVVNPVREKRAKTALTNYQGFSKNGEEVASNVFDLSKAKGKGELPPRDPSGRFVPKADAEQTPYLITEEQFFANEPEHDQENTLYFANEKTILRMVDHEPVEIDIVGEVNLTLFPPAEGDDKRIICVRNEGLGVDYEIEYTEESLTEYMGMSES